MTRYLTAGLLVLGAPQLAFAATLTLSSNGTNITVTDCATAACVNATSSNSAIIVGDSNTSAGTINANTASGQTLGGWTITIASGTSFSPTTNPAEDLDVFASCSTGCSTLLVTFNDTGFTTIPPVGSGFNLQFGPSASVVNAWEGATTFDATGTPTNGNHVFGPLTGPLAAAGVNGGVGSPITAPYSLTVQETFSTPGSYSSDAQLSVFPAPEPASLLLMGSGLVGLAGYVRRKKRNVR